MAGQTKRLRRVDDALFRLEQGLVATSLIAITVMVFLDVVYRRLVSQDSRLGRAIATLLFIDGRGARAFVDATVAPVVGVVLGLGFLYLAYRAAERARGAPLLPIPMSAAMLALATGAAIALFGWAMLVLRSRDVYLLLFALSAGGRIVHLYRKRPVGWVGQSALILGVATPFFLWIAFRHLPTGYTWAKELSMLFVLWVGFFGASVCVHEGKHIRLEALEKAPPPALRPFLGALSHLVAAGFAAFLAWLGYRYVFDPTTGLYHLDSVLEQTELPDWIMAVAVPVAFGLAALRMTGAAVSTLLGGTYGAPAKAEGLEEAEKIAAERGAAAAGAADTKPKRPITFFVVLALIVLAPLLGKGGILVSTILAAALLAEPLFVVLGFVCVVCFVLWGDVKSPAEFSILVERIRSLADNQALLAVPFFIMSGAVMGRGQIGRRLVGFAEALVGWMPGGLAISAVMACMIFAAISGSSPATVVAIGGMMGPALIGQGYNPSFSHGLVTSAGSLGILVPPSIPMIVYAIVNQTTSIEVERLFACGFGPGLVIGGILMGYSLVRGVRDKTPTTPFSLARLWAGVRDGIWALMLPGIILGGIYLGIFNAIEAACVSVVYAVVVEVWIHRAIKLGDVPGIFQETGLLLGSFLVILVVAMSFGEFLEGEQIPAMASQWMRSLDLEAWQFLLAINLLLLVVGCLMDIMSAIFIFVPLLAPMAVAVGVDPMHLGIIFIVNLEIGYLTPPVGLNLFVASTLFGRPMTYMMRATLPFIALMMIGLGVVTYVPAVSVGLATLIMGEDDRTAGEPEVRAPPEPERPEKRPPTKREPTKAPPTKGGVQSIEQMMRELEGDADGGAAEPDGGAAAPEEPPARRGKVQSIEEMMREVEGKNR